MKITYSRSARGVSARILSIISLALFFLAVSDFFEFDVCKVLLYAFTILWISNVIYCFDIYSKRYIFLVLNLTYFLFYMGRIVLSYFMTGDYLIHSHYLKTFSMEITEKTFVIIYLGLFFLRVFAVLLERPSSFSKPFDKSVDWGGLNKIAYQLFWVTLPFSYLVVLERVIFVSATGYASYYTTFSSSLPSIVTKMDGFNEILFFLFLGTFPDKRKAKKAIIAFLGLGVLSLFYGQRNPLAIKAVFIFLIYIPLRDSLVGENEEKWMTRKIKLFCAIAFPALIVLFSAWVFVRNAGQFDGGLVDLILDFFDTEGNSVYLIALGIDHIDEFPDGIYYTLGPIHDFITNNVVYKAIFGNYVDISSRTYEGVINSWGIGGLLSYFQSPSAFAAGVGTGTCYLVEAFVDFGYVGIALISFIYMKIITYVQNYRGNNWILFSIGLISVYDILYAPRDLALSFVNKFFSFSFIAMVVFVYFLYKRNTGRRYRINE